MELIALPQAQTFPVQVFPTVRLHGKILLPLAARKSRSWSVSPFGTASSSWGKILHTRNQHLRNRPGFPVAFSNGCSVACSNGISHFSGICPDPRGRAAGRRPQGSPSTIIVISVMGNRSNETDANNNDNNTNANYNTNHTHTANNTSMTFEALSTP